MIALMVWGVWRQAHGGVRYAMSEPIEARRMIAAMRNDPAIADSERPDALVEITRSGSFVAFEWPGRSGGESPPWDALHAAVDAHMVGAS